ncbi:hypothetical protein HPY42_00235 [Coprothermobacteraceae bacterium]|nr:hypothetical protein [Coprothermobacteraceae bacterium]
MDMEQMCESFPEWLLEAETLTERLPFEEMHRKIIVGAMGGSAIGADLVNTAYYDVLPPIPIVRDYRLPFWIGDGTFVASSYSGNTEETLALLKEAEARKLYIVGVSSDGAVEEYCAKHNRPFVKLPGGLPPRMALPYSARVISVLVEKLYGIKLPWREAATFLKKHMAEIKDVALEIADKLVTADAVYVLSSQRDYVLALRFAGEISENTKLVAGYLYMPEANHNFLQGFQHGASKTVGIAIYEDTEKHSRVELQSGFLYRKAEENGSPAVKISLKGETRLAKILYGILVGDFASIYMAQKKGIDPMPVHIITELKNYLKQA